MPKLLYISPMRLPTEKAHGLQIMQNCEAFADAGYEVTLWVARRWNRRELRAITDDYAYYGVERAFRIRRIPCIDIFPLFPAAGRGDRLAFALQLLSFAFVCTLLLLGRRADIYYSRDKLIVWLLSWLKPKRAIAYEAHQFAPSARGAQLQRRAASRAGSVIAITQRLRQDLVRHRGAAPARCITLPDGIRRARFQNLPPAAQARAQLGWSQQAFIVGYVGRLQTLGMDKGVDMLVAALAAVPGAHLALVGGPADMAESLRRRWLALGLPPERFLYAGQVLPAAVPSCLSAFDVCAMPLPKSAHFTFYASPLKLFEYMAAGKAIAASDLPAWADVVHDGETALLLPPEDPAAWAQALTRLRDDSALRQRLGERAREVALGRYTWDARAAAILAHIATA